MMMLLVLYVLLLDALLKFGFNFGNIQGKLYPVLGLIVYSLALLVYGISLVYSRKNKDKRENNMKNKENSLKNKSFDAKKQENNSENDTFSQEKQANTPINPIFSVKNKENSTENKQKYPKNSLFGLFFCPNNANPVLDLPLFLLSLLISMAFLEFEVLPFPGASNLFEGVKMGLLESLLLYQMKSLWFRYVSLVFLSVYVTFRAVMASFWLQNMCLIAVCLFSSLFFQLVGSKNHKKPLFSEENPINAKTSLDFMPNQALILKILKKSAFSLQILDSGLNSVLGETVPLQTQVRLIKLKPLNNETPLEAPSKGTLRDYLTSILSQKSSDAELYGVLEVLTPDKFAYIRVYAYKHKNESFLALNLVDKKPDFKLFAENQTKVLSFVSHEFRTPLNCITGMLQCLEEKVPLGTYEQFIQPALSSGKYLLNMLQDILDMTQIKAGKFALNPIDFDLELLLKDIFTLFQVPAKTKKISLSFEISPNVPKVIKTDPNRLKQILINLLSNAFKYTQKGSIILMCHPIGESSRTLRFSVEDTGLGIKDTDKPKLLQAFGRVEDPKNRQLNPQGVGLGLLISQDISKLLAEGLSGLEDGEKGLLFESEYGKGSVFSFIIENLKGDVLIDIVDIGLIPVGEEDSCKGPHSFVEKLSRNEKKFIIREDPVHFEARSHYQTAKSKWNSLSKTKLPTEVVCQMGFPRGDEVCSSLFRIKPKLSEKEVPSIYSQTVLKSYPQQDTYASFQLYPVFEKTSILNEASISISSNNSKKSCQELSKIEEIVNNIENFKPKCACPSVLIVDDDSYNILALQFLLESLNIRYDTAGSGEEAIQKVKAPFLVDNGDEDHDFCCRFFQIILLDIEMPSKNGIETCKEIKDFLKTVNGEKNTQLVACSGYSDQENNQRIREAGFERQLVKPIMKGTLIGILSEFLEIGPEKHSFH